MKTCFLFLVIASVLSGCSQTDPAFEKAIRSALEKLEGDITVAEMESLTTLDLKGLTMLEMLDLNITQITDVGLVHIKDLPKLEMLLLTGTQVTDSSLVHLNGLTRLTSLNLRGTQVTDEGRQELKSALPGLSFSSEIVGYMMDPKLLERYGLLPKGSPEN